MDKGFQDILLDIQVPFGDLTKGFARLGQVFDRLADTEVPEVVGSGFSAQQQVIAHILFNGVLLVIGSDDGIAKVQVVNGGLKGISKAFGDAATENHTYLIRPSDRAIGVEQTFGDRIQCGATAVSIPANIAEGFTRRGKTEKARFMNIAEGSLEESRYYLILAQDLGYGETSALRVVLEEASRLLNAYARAILASGS